MKKSAQSLLYSTVGLVAVFMVLVAVNYLAGRVPKRIDLTEEKAYTLSEGTRSILSRLPSPIQIRLYATRNETIPPQLRLYVQQVEDLLEEIRQASNGRVEVQKLNPEPDSEAEDSARLDGVEGQPLPNGEQLYLGLSVSLLDRKEAIAFLSPERERLLEYDIARTISRVITEEKPVVGVMSPLPLAGMPNAPMMMMQMPRGRQEPWVFYSELQRDFTVREIPLTADAIPEEVKVLLVIHPRGISEATEYALDQFVLRGGKLIAYLDPSAVTDEGQGGGMPGSPSEGSNLEKLLSAWGINFESTQTVADMEYIARTQRGRAPGVLALQEGAFSKDDVLTTGTSNLYMIFAGAFTGTPVEGLKKTVLVHSSNNAALVDPMMAQMAPDSISKSFQPSGQPFDLAIRLTGKFRTAFPNGKPSDEQEEPASDEKKDEPEEAKKATAEATPQGLKESAAENTVLLIGDADLLHDQVTVIEQTNPFTGGKVLYPANGNLAFVQAAVEQLAGDSDLIAVRSRASRDRPFTVVQAIEAKAVAAYQNKMMELEASLAETESKLNALQQEKGGESGQRFILSEEQQKEVERFRATEVDVRRQLKEVRRELRSESDALKNRVQWINIALMPTLVAATGLVLAAFQRKRTAAK